MADLALFAPMHGWLCDLDEVDDPVFAGRLLGDGLAIDPTAGCVHAPCDGVIVQVHGARHAVVLRAANGAEILVHVGLETVALGGVGFEALIAEGQSVLAGEPLLTFDLDAVAGAARGLISPIVIANGEEFEVLPGAVDRRVAPGEAIMTIRRRLPAAARTLAGSAAAPTATDWVVSPLAHGLHARPAARVVAALRGFDAEVHLVLGEKRASARSVLAMMALGVARGDRLGLSATGPDAAEAVARLRALIEGGRDEPSPSPTESELPSVRPSPVASPFGLAAARGLTASPGLAIGQAFRVSAIPVVVPETAPDAHAERGRLAGALSLTRDALRAEARLADPLRRGLLEAHLALIDDPALASAAEADIAAGKSAAFAWRRATVGQARMLQALADSRMAERAADLADLERRVLARLLPGQAASSGAPRLPPDAIVLADDILPSQLMALDPARLAGLCLAAGGPTAHVALLAQAMGVPMVVAAGPGVLTAATDGARVILDADAGVLIAEPSDAAVATATATRAARRADRERDLAAALDPCRLADGTPIPVLANLAAAGEAGPAVAAGAEGCGLLRTELMFADRASPPDEDEQARLYGVAAAALAGRPLVIRTLDAGGDKPLAFLPMPTEANPALGLRGVRAALWRPDLLVTQLRAILRTSREGPCAILIPMVVEVGELRAVRALLDAARRDLRIAEPVPLGVMVETPAAAVTADLLAAEADFLSIGANDLAQYVLAMDRGDPALAARVDGLHPAVLRLIAQTCEGAARHRRSVSLCGALASDPLAAPILVGLGVERLSASASAIAAVKARLRLTTLADCRALAADALVQTSAGAVRALALAATPASGLAA